MSPSTVAGRRPGRRRSIAGAAIVVVCLGLLTLVYGAIAPRGSAASSTDPDVVAGKGLYVKYSCASCHGMNAEGGAKAPSLIGVGAAAVDFQMSAGFMPLQHHGAQAVRHAPVAPENEIQQIAAYIQSLAPGQITHAGHHAEPGFGQFHRGQQANAAR